MLMRDPDSGSPACRFGLGCGIVLLLMVIWACAGHERSALSKFESYNYSKKPVNHKDLAEEYYHQKQYEKAKSELRLALMENPRDVDAHFRLGVIYGKEDAVKESRIEFERVIAIDPQYSKAYYNLGVIFSKEDTPGSLEKSIEYFDKFLELEPDSAQKQQIEQYKYSHSE